MSNGSTELGFFHDKFSNRFAKTCPLTIEDLRAWGNFEVTEHLSNRGEAEMARSARRLHDFEKRFKDPNDALVEAERLKKNARRKSARSWEEDPEGRCGMKAEVYAHLHAFSASFEQAWDAVQKLQPHLDLTRSELKEIYFRLEQARFETLDHLTELANRFEDTLNIVSGNKRRCGKPRRRSGFGRRAKPKRPDGHGNGARRRKAMVREKQEKKAERGPGLPARFRWCVRGPIVEIHCARKPLQR